MYKLYMGLVFWGGGDHIYIYIVFFNNDFSVSLTLKELSPSGGIIKNANIPHCDQKEPSFCHRWNFVVDYECMCMWRGYFILENPPARDYVKYINL